MTGKFTVHLAPGCHGKAFDPVISRHQTLESALNKARKSDRLYAADDRGNRWQIPQQNDPDMGLGRYGNGITKEAALDLGWPLN